MMTKILIVENETMTSVDIVSRLKDDGYGIVGQLDSGEDAIAMLASDPPDLVLMDVFLKGNLDGIDAAEIITSRYQIPVIFLTNHTDKTTLERAKNTSAGGYFVKPFDVQGLSATLELVLHKHRLERQLVESEARFHKIFNYSNDPIFLLDASKDEILEVNPAACVLAGHVRKRLLSMKISDIYCNEAAPLKTFTQAVFENGNGKTEALSLLTKPGKSIPVEISASVTTIDERPCIIAIVRDITEKRQAEQWLHLTSAVMESAVDGILITDASGCIQAVNAAFCAMTGYGVEEVIGQNPSLLQSGKQDASFYKEMWSTMLSDGKWRGEIWNKRKNGEIYAEALSISAIKSEQGQVTHFVAIFSDITDRKRRENQLTFLSSHDPLTGLPNRLLFQDRLTQAIAQADRWQQRFALLFLDLNRFKTINDTLGHQMGDKLLKAVGERLSKVIRDVDSVARYGGDEFTIILTEINSRDDVESVIKKINESLTGAVDLGGRKFSIETSIGISIYPTDGIDSDALIAAADAAMYVAKNEKKSGYQFSGSRSA